MMESILFRGPCDLQEAVDLAVFSRRAVEFPCAFTVARIEVERDKGDLDLKGCEVLDGGGMVTMIPLGGKGEPE